METKAQGDNKAYLYHTLCVLAGVVALFPVSGNYILYGGFVEEWIARVGELASGFQDGQLYLFPSAETFVASGIKVNAMDSNLWFFIPGLLYRISGNIVAAYRVYMLAVQLGALFAAILMFQRIFADRDTKLPVSFGVLLYMTCPYRIYICYDLANLSQAAAWTLVPLYVWAVMGAMGGDKRGRFRNTAAAALILAGIGYADVVIFLAAAGITMLAGLALRQFRVFLSLAAGGIVFLPGLYRLIQYLFLGGFPELDMPLESIMENGYKAGFFFSSYVFQDGYPGMGLGMLICLLAGGWMAFVEDKRASGVCKMFAGISVFSGILSLSCFPWDFFQRLGGWALKVISLINTPAVFWGMALTCMCVPAACSVNRISRHENKLIAYAVPVIVMVACLWVCVYQCNTLMYTRLQLERG